MKTCIITGASRGIGRAAASLFASEGYRLVITYKNSEKEALALAQSLPADVYPIRYDAANRDDCRALYAFALSKLGHIDVLVNNAGIAQQKLLFDITDDELSAMMDANFTGAFTLTRLVGEHMVSRGRGAVVNVASMWGQVGASCESHYSASKAALIGFTKAAAKELGPSGVRVNCVCPGVIDTDMCAHLSQEDRAALMEETPLGRLGTPEDVAHAIAFLASEKASFITGQILGVNGGFVI